MTFIGWTPLPPATKLQQGNVFTPVCHSVHRGGVCTPQADTPSHSDTPGQTPPAQCMLRYTPPAQCMLGYSPSCPVHAGIHTPCPVHAGIWSTSGQYTSYWNAFLLILFLVKKIGHFFCVGFSEGHDDLNVLNWHFFHFIQSTYISRKHSSRMHTASLVTVYTSIATRCQRLLGGGCPQVWTDLYFWPPHVTSTGAGPFT